MVTIKLSEIRYRYIKLWGRRKKLKTEFTRSSSNKWTKTLYLCRLFTSYCKPHYDCFKYLVQKKLFLATPNVENKCWTLHETLESTGEMKLMLKFYLGIHNFSGLWNLFSRVPVGNCFWYYFEQLFMSLAFRKGKKDCNVRKVIFWYKVLSTNKLNCSIFYRISSEACLVPSV